MKVKVGSCDGQGEGYSRPIKGQSGRQHKTIGIAGIAAGQGNGVADDMMSRQGHVGGYGKGRRRADGR